MSPMSPMTIYHTSTVLKAYYRSCSYYTQYTHAMGSALVLNLVLDHMDSNKMALDGRLVCKAVKEHLCLPGQCTARLSLPLPPSACDAAWQPHVQQAFQQAFRQLSFIAKVRVPFTAASSGSERNLELAWSLLRPCLFPGLLLPIDFYGEFWFDEEGFNLEDPGKAAIIAGHVHLLPWLVRNRCPVHRDSISNAAAEQMDLEGVQQVVQLLGGGPDPPGEH